MRTKIVAFILIFTCCHFIVQGQFNIKVGYNLAYTPGEEFNLLIADFNLANASVVERPMKDLHFMAGIEIGLRYRINSTAFEFSFDNINKDREALGENVDGSAFEERIFYSQRGLNASIETRFGNYGWGLGISTRNQRVRKNIATLSAKKDVFSSRSFALKMFLAFDLGGSDRLSFELRPFFIYPLNTTDFSLLANELGLSATSYPEERFITFGVALVFYNGPQH